MKDSEHLPILRKANEILDLVRMVTGLFPEDNQYLQMMKMQLLEDAMILPVKISGAEAVKLYDIKMENATLVRKAAKNLQVSYHSLEMFGFDEVNYYKIVREKIEELRLLFIDWVAGFNQTHFITDDWGLFNPPGISPDYEQRSDELNFLDEDDE
ncbi:hypothetical protein [Elizabethkingia anophelis]|uniref:hypothetical protein n=1 Tax=Elizabethkingia anophelis TaxID=1117645 RepID=UPI000442C98F|nr:hypothetical protein [Elizabethkingia anophelis]CDN73612.1 conserved hypothetical protein [Elizabethkingia anophelis]CDN79876.1 conserved hypothetical protein [Elizabethkingia anophelis]